MLLAIIVLLIIFWFLGYINLSVFPIPNIALFNINGQEITLFKLAILLLIIWAIGILPTPFRQIGIVLLILWLLSTLGILAIAGLSSILVIIIILGIAVSLFM